ncbi:MAG: cysteine--tRNA ligase [Candidatus Woykebacteria bacterium RBG_19FT_COMBO_43_10]|uniref:Cysteine--tRNA ligase n=1 Tax=Candidatus Woykebacteria bacterium RBG_19FT_COMBO_43_10 TaxID=1802598 RepID=A0A1G1WJH8_9BACT|nr:MAG: cysteine--tRNA ligase [Candidatus Woykebacteria bacterium RBG_19FT_COMBO_43_10]
MFLSHTLTRKKEKFVPIEKGKVGIYSCGPTVYRDIHIGNLRTYLAADILKRLLIYNGYKVKHIKNITDVGHMRTDPTASKLRGASEATTYDPIITEALEQGKTPQQIAETYTQKFLEDEKRLNILPADTFPKATEHIKEMIEMTKALLDKGYAYVADGTIYFSVKKFKDYGKLSGNTLNKMGKLLAAVRVATETDKKDSADFALWKKAEEDRSLKWASPWGEGFPGWHIECSAMSMKYLGPHFDIHTGAEDNIFPHHEDEIAQSEAATGEKFVNYWIHAGFLLVDGKKMARREGNVYTVSDIVEKGFKPLALRYLSLTAHYRSRLNFTWKSLEAAATALNNLYREVTGYATADVPKVGCAEYEQRFLAAVNDDIDTPTALSIVQELVGSDYPPSAKLQSLFKFDQVLGLDLEKVAGEASQVPDKVKELVQEREKARKDNDFKTADKIRTQIKSKGYEVVDTEKGPKLKKILRS